MNNKNRIIFTWDIHLDCNYRCPYCWFHGNWENVKKNNRYLSAEVLVGYWQNIHDKYGKVLITVVGGEPLSYPDFSSVFEKLSLIHDLEITTNLSLDRNKLEEFIEEVRGRNVKISASFHPLFAQLNAFLDKVKLLKENDILGGVLYLAWPPQVKEIPYYKREFEKAGLNFSVLTFLGQIQGQRISA